MLKVKNWSDHQHYKDRSPPWIKLQTNLFQDYEFSRLQDASKLLAICCWTLASRSKDGSLPDDFEFIKAQGFLKNVEEKDLEALVKSGFLIRASDVLADCKQNACPEERRDRGEGETEGETYRKENYAKERKPEDTSTASPEVIMQFETFWQACPRKGDKARTRDEWIRACTRDSWQSILAGLERYNGYIQSGFEDVQYIKGSENWLKNDQWKNAYLKKNEQPKIEKPRRFAAVV